MFTLTENKTTGLWEDKEICFGDGKYCTNKLSGGFERYILSFGEDEGGILINYIQFFIIKTYCCDELDWKTGYYNYLFLGELYILSTSLPSSTETGGKVYRLVDPGR